MSVYAISDLHGQLDLLQAVKDRLKPEDKCYVLGDCGDRGPHGWQCIKGVYFDPQFIYIKGNHEEMLCNAMHGMTLDCYSNGGRSTLNSWRKEDNNVLWYNRLKHLPTLEKYINTAGQTIILTHAGFTLKEPEIKINEHDLLWSRQHFYDEWSSEFKNTYIIHGHTPTPILYSYLYPNIDLNKPYVGMLTYAKGHKIDIDVGTFAYDYCSMLNLDTFEETLIRGTKCKII